MARFLIPAMAVALGISLGCGGDGDGPDFAHVATDTAGDTGGHPDVSDADVGPTTDLYQPAQSFEIVTTTFVGAQAARYTDVLGVERLVPFAIYRPKGTPGRAPIVLMSHGGAEGKVDPLKSMEHWAPVVAKAGYVVVAIAHVPRERDPYEALCAHLGVGDFAPDGRCGIKLNWDRPHDIAAVLDALEVMAVGEPWSVLLDLGRIAHMGHSAGAGAALMVGGAPRNFVCAQQFGLNQGTVVPCALDHLVSLRDPRIRAIVAMSPQGPGADGFMNESFPALAVPMLIGTGRQDGDPGERANRIALFPLAPENARWGIYIDDVGTKHTLFEASLDACTATGTSLDRCKEMRSWLFSTVLAFLDAELRDSAKASAWLSSDTIESTSAGVAALCDNEVITPVEPGVVCADAPPVASPLYVSPRQYSDVRELTGFSLTGALAGRELPLMIRYAADAVGPLPVVLWAHSGGYSSTAHLDHGAWSNTLARAGYAVIHVSHVPPTDLQLEAICDLVHITDPLECVDLGAGPGPIVGDDPANPFSSIGVTRPADTKHILDRLGFIAGRLAERDVELDTERVALVGWSGGAQNSMQLAGATRDLSATVLHYAAADVRPDAFVALSPQGPGFSGFFDDGVETSWDDVRGPMLVVTGKGDKKPDHGGLTGPVRRLTYDHMPAGDKYLFYSSSDNPAINHNDFNLTGLGSGDPEVAALAAALPSVVLAFLDWHIRGEAAAQAWLDDDPSATVDGAADWERK